MEITNKPIFNESEEENSWIVAAMQGDKSAFSQLYLRHSGQVHAFCMRMLQGKADVEDAVQQVFLEAWRSLCRFERRSMFSTWLIKIAIHTCLSFHRKTGRMVLAQEDDSQIYEHATEVLWGTAQSAPDEQIWSAIRRRTVWKLVNRMTKKKQLVLILSDMQGMTAPEISNVLGIPDATVRTRLFHARRELATHIKRNLYYRQVLVPEPSNSRRMSA